MRTHRLVQKGAIVEHYAPEKKEVTEPEFFEFMEKILARCISAVIIHMSFQRRQQGKHLSEALQQHTLQALDILYVRIIDAPGLIGASGYLVYVVACTPEQGRDFPQLRQVEIYDITVYGHLTQIRREILTMTLFHLLLDHIVFFLRHIELDGDTISRHGSALHSGLALGR